MADIRRQSRAWLASVTLALGVLGGGYPGSSIASEASEAVIDPAGEPASSALAIRRITVAPSGAWISRRITSAALEPLLSGNGAAHGLTLSEGAGGRLWVHDLPASLASASLRVSGARFDASTGLRLEREPPDQTARYKALNEALVEARAEGRAIRVRIEDNALRREIARDQLGSLPAEGDIARLWAEGGPVAGLMDRLSEARRSLLDRRAANEERQRELRERLDELTGQGAGWKLGIPLRAAPEGTDGDAVAIGLEYRVDQAGWEPVYEARLDTVEDRVDWRMTAHVHQQSGEDWPAASMTLVTSDRRRFYPVPSLSPLTIGFVDPDRRQPIQPMAEMAAPALATRAGGVEASDDTGFASQIAINRPARVPSGSGGVSLEVFDQTLDAKVELRLAPQDSLDAVLVGRFEPSVAQPLPPGRWEVHRDGQQQAGPPRQGISPGEAVELSFGADPRIEVDFRRLPDERAGHGLIGKFNQIERRRTLEVTSHHGRPLPMTVLMRLPTALDADIVVEPLADMTSPSVRDHEDKAGVWAWRRDLSPGEPWQIDFAYRVRWPEDKAITPF
ncbi:MAG: DUF4139 domain-containing protein [Pseudomonadota bacterium]